MASPQLSISPIIRLSVIKSLTKNLVNIKLAEMSVEPRKATRRHLYLSIKMHTNGLKNKGTACMSPLVMNTDDSDSFLLKNVINSRLNMPKDSETPSAIKYTINEPKTMSHFKALVEVEFI